MLIHMVILFLGAQLLIVDTCSFIKKTIKFDLVVYSVKNNIVWIVDVIGIKIWHANSIKFQRQFLNKIKHFWILSKERSLNSVLNVNFGYRKMKDAITWHVNANFNSVINVEGFIWNVNVCKKQDSKCS